MDALLELPLPGLIPAGRSPDRCPTTELHSSLQNPNTSEIKMRLPLFGFALVLPIWMPTAYSAETTIRPGLWEVTTTSDVLKLVLQIPPDQMQKLMTLAKQHGFDMPQIQNGAATSRVCITQEMADQKDLLDFYPNQSGCTVNNVIHAGNKYSLDFVCANSQLKGNGTAVAKFTNPENFTGQSTFTGVLQGNPVNEHDDVSGRWINEGCGTVSPPR